MILSLKLIVFSLLHKVKEQCQELLVQCATPDAMARLSRTKLKFQAKDLWDMYFRQQEHSSLQTCLAQLLNKAETRQAGCLVQVSTHSRLLSENDIADICQATKFKRRDLELLTLQQFQTEQQFLKQVRLVINVLLVELTYFLTECFLLYS
jgi:hypothetical protein